MFSAPHNVAAGVTRQSTNIRGALLCQVRLKFVPAFSFWELEIAMINSSAGVDASLEMCSPDGSSRNIRLAQTPFLIGRSVDNHLAIADDYLSRKCAVITQEDNRYFLEDRGNHGGVFVNGARVSRQSLENGDVITFGPEVTHSLVFHQTSSNGPSIQNLVSRLEGPSETDTSGGLERLNLLLEATRLLHSHLPLDTILEAMLDRAITVTDADRALLLEATDSGSFQPRLARRKGSHKLRPESFAPSSTAIKTALEKRSAVITQDLALANDLLQTAQSIVNQRLLAVIAIPLYGKASSGPKSSADVPGRRFLGVMYLDSQRKAAFSNLDRQIL